MKKNFDNEIREIPSFYFELFQQTNCTQKKLDKYIEENKEKFLYTKHYLNNTKIINIGTKIKENNDENVSTKLKQVILNQKIASLLDPENNLRHDVWLTTDSKHCVAYQQSDRNIRFGRKEFVRKKGTIKGIILSTFKQNLYDNKFLGRFLTFSISLVDKPPDVQLTNYNIAVIDDFAKYNYETIKI